MTVSDSVPVCAMRTCPLPLNDTVEKPATVLGSLTILPDPAIPFSMQPLRKTEPPINKYARTFAMTPPRTRGDTSETVRRFPRLRSQVHPTWCGRRSIYSRPHERSSTPFAPRVVARAVRHLFSLRCQRPGLPAALASYPRSHFWRHRLCGQHRLGEFHGRSGHRQRRLGQAGRSRAATAPVVCERRSGDRGDRGDDDGVVFRLSALVPAARPGSGREL